MDPNATASRTLLGRLYRNSLISMTFPEVMKEFGRRSRQSKREWCYYVFDIYSRITVNGGDKLRAKKKMPGMIQRQRDDVSSL
ncbi:hypothetical protein KC326_g143 [Hortaea werneckii]|nr:hypothetical protein KC326_g143 [Hortaea werneckii]